MLKLKSNITSREAHISILNSFNIKTYYTDKYFETVQREMFIEYVLFNVASLLSHMFTFQANEYKYYVEGDV